MNIGARIKEARKARGLTQKQLADKAGLAEITIRQYENNKREPSLSTLHILSDALAVTLLYLLGDDMSIDDAFSYYDNYKKYFDSHDAIVTLLSYQFGGYEKRYIDGKYSSLPLNIFGNGDDAFCLDDEDLSVLLEKIKSMLPSLVQQLEGKSSVEDAIRDTLDLLNSDELKEFLIERAESNGEQND